VHGFYDFDNAVVLLKPMPEQLRNTNRRSRATGKGNARSAQRCGQNADECGWGDGAVIIWAIGRGTDTGDWRSTASGAGERRMNIVP
jgi:hypothetical protein